MIYKNEACILRLSFSKHFIGSLIKYSTKALKQILGLTKIIAKPLYETYKKFQVFQKMPFPFKATHLKHYS